jgi:galactokinase
VQQAIFITVDELTDRLLAAFDAHYSGRPDVLARAPGRVNLIGEHTDYNDGFVLPMAIGCQTMVAARARNDDEVRLCAVDLDDATTQFSLREPIVPDQGAAWSNYVRGVADSLMHNGLKLRGADLVIAGNIPRGAGLSSSASLEIAAGLVFSTLAGQPEFDRTSLALAGQRAEHVFAGCHCGIMDQLVSAHGVANHALLIDCRSLAMSQIAMPDTVAVMIVHSGIARGLVDGEYNMRRLQCELAARHYGVAALRDLDAATLKKNKAGLDAIAFARARHVVSENDRTLAAAQALAVGDLNLLGNLMAQSHASMRDDFGITTPAIDDLVTLLQAVISGDGGARMTGGGFGGTVVAILPTAKVEATRAAVLSGYKSPAGASPRIMIELASASASLILL